MHVLLTGFALFVLVPLAAIAAITAIGGLLVLICRTLVACGILRGVMDFSEPDPLPQESGAWPPSPTSGK